LNTETVSPGGKKRFRFRFETLDYFYSGTSPSFSTYDFASNVIVTSTPNSYTVDVVNVNKNNGN
jgi:hypothetical protein